MDGESSYESDVSESWSLIDVNLNEESVSVTNTQPKLEETYLPDSKDENLKKSDSIELEDFVRQCRESVSGFCKSCQSDSDSSIENHEALNGDESDRCSEQDKNDSGDAESIEILDVDGNQMDSELERLDISVIDCQELKNCAYQSDDEESWGGSIDNKIRSTSLTVIQRKKNLVRHSKSSDDVNSDFIYKGKPNLSNHLDDEKNVKKQVATRSTLPVYKHYRNNVVNTILSLSMGIVFAGVTCIAIGHFLGVHDAAETAMELVDALKKLQMENVALQSRWSQLNRAVLKQNINSKFELPPTKPPEAVSCEKRPNYGPVRTKTTNINQATLSEIQSSLKSMQWLTKLENMINEKIENEGNEVDFRNIGKYIHNQLNVINDKKVEGFRLLEDSDKKISKLLRKIIEKLSASQENIENLYNRLIRLKDKMNHKLFLDKTPRKVPVTENDLNSMQWYSGGNNPPEEYSKSIRVFEFPQPEEYYKMENNSVSTEERTITKKNNYNNNTLKEKNEGKSRKKRGGKKWRKEKSKGAEEKLLKKQKHSVKISEKMTVKKYKTNEQGQMKYAFGRFNETRETDKKFSKGKDEEKAKRKMKKVKKSKILRASLSKQNKHNHLRKTKQSRICSGYECFNLTGYWVFKYADGREEFRRHQTLSDWQFERAKGRKEQRDEDYLGSWQFRRALARENGRNDHRWRPERYRKNYDSQDFYHETYS